MKIPLLHVTHLIESFAAGSLTALSTLCAHVQDGIRHSVIYSHRQETPADFQSFFPPDTQFYHVAMCRSVHPWRDALAYKNIIHLLRKLQPDVLHCHSSKAGVLGRLAAWQLGIPAAYTPHGYAFLRTDIPRPLSQLYKFVEYGMAYMGKAIIACGEEEFHISQKFAHKNAEIYFVANSIHPQPAQRPLLTLVSAETSPRLQVGTMGRVAPQRDPALFGALAKELQHEALWTWIGASQDEANLPPHVQKTGWVNRPTAMAALDTLDIYIQTSRWEGLSYSILEAMSKGKPVIATDIPANRAVIKHGVTGFLGKNVQELSAHVRTLLSDPARRLRMGEAAQDYIQTHHSAASVYRVYHDIYRKLAVAREN